MRRIIGMLAITVAVIASGALPAGAAKSKASKGCETALEVAEIYIRDAKTHISLRDGVQSTMTQALTSTRDFATALNGVTKAITDGTAAIKSAPSLTLDEATFQDAVKKCRAGK